MRLSCLAPLVVAISAVPATAATNILTNGSFENGLTGWNVTTTGSNLTGYRAPVVIAYNQSSQYPTGAFREVIPTDNNTLNPNLDAAGNYGLYLSSDVGTQTISQSVTLKANTTYTFGFDYYLPANGYDNPYNATFAASLNGQSFASFNAGSQSQTSWQLASGNRTFTTGQNGTFNFTFSANGSTAKDFVVDRVYLAETSTLAAVPEPATWLTMILGFGFLGATLRRSRRPADTLTMVAAR